MHKKQGRVEVAGLGAVHHLPGRGHGLGREEGVVVGVAAPGRAVGVGATVGDCQVVSGLVRGGFGLAVRPCVPYIPSS